MTPLSNICDILSCLFATSVASIFIDKKLFFLDILNQSRRGWTGLDGVRRGWTGLEGVGQGWTGLDVVGQGLTGLDGVALQEPRRVRDFVYIL